MISICMAYYDRKRQLFKTLESIKESEIKDYEIIIVDDASPEHLNINELKTLTNGNVVLIEVQPESKSWYNSCIAYNIALSRASGEKIIYQNPECLHLGDILKDVEIHLKDGQYFSYQTIAINESATEGLRGLKDLSNVRTFMRPIINTTTHISGGQNPYVGFNIWYVHPIYRAKHYHFTAAITRKDMLELGGFDERYQHDAAWDDNEILERIKRKNLSMQIIDREMVVHQYHTDVCMMNCPHKGSLNNKLFHKTTMHDTRVKIQNLDYNNYTTFIKEIK